MDFRHVTRLAGALARIVAVQPFQVRHLLRKSADLLAVSAQSPGFERMAGAAHCGVPDMRRFRGTEPSRRGAHDALMASGNCKRTVFRMLVLGRRRVDNKTAVETLPRSEFFLRDLVAYRTGHAIFGRGVLFVVLVKRKMGEHFAPCALQLSLVAADGHMADRTLILDRRFGFWMIDRFAPDTPLPVRVARRISHHTGTPIEADGDVLARGSRESIVTSHAAVGGLKTWFCSRWPFAALFAATQQFWRPRQQTQQEDRDNKRIANLSSHHHPSFSLPSAQSQRR